MNDNSYAYDIAANLIEMAPPLFSSSPRDLKEAEKQLALEEDVLEDLDEALK